MTDKTIHDLAIHIEKSDEEQVAQNFNSDGTAKHGKTPSWYQFWDAHKPHCPTCEAPADVS